jgi:hypothetical protein
MEFALCSVSAGSLESVAQLGACMKTGVFLIACVFVCAAGVLAYTNVKKLMLPLKRYSFGYKTTQIACQLSQEDLCFALYVGRRPTSFQRDLYTEISS